MVFDIRGNGLVQWGVMGQSLYKINPVLQSNSRFQGSRVPFRFSGPAKNGAPLPHPEIETQQSLLLGILQGMVAG